MLLGFFTEDAYQQLINQIPENLEKYVSGDDWVGEFFKNRTDYYKMSSVNVGKFTPYYTIGKKADEEKNEQDFINARSLHDAFKNLTPLQASNRYMWAYLCHMDKEYRKYIQDRWLLDPEENKVRQRYFVGNDADGLYYFNALARLWWCAHLTYDENSADHYALTKILFTSQIFCKDVMDTLNRMNFTRVKGVLLGVKDYMDNMGERVSTDHFRECKKILNRKAAIRVFDFMDVDDIRQITYKALLKTRKSKGVSI